MIGEEVFELPVQYKDQEISLPAVLSITGYTHKFKVNVEGQDILFEPDEENNYRARINYDDGGISTTNITVLDENLLKAITESIERLFK